MKRFVCFLLTLVLLVGLVPAAVLTANAASVLNTSDKAVEILKKFEGFSANAYEDGGKYYIGYGTLIDDPAVYPQGITQSKATELLKEHLAETVDKEINNFAKKFNLALSQNQHDALALFSYNCGTGWMLSDGAFRSAVVNGKRGNEFLNAMALWTGGDTSSDYFRGLMNRRMAEANMYLNNMYSSAKPANYTYVVLDVAGGTLKDAYGNNLVVFAYDSSTAPAIDLAPTKSGDSFLGWYVNDVPVTTLDATLATKTLTAKWQNGSGSVSANYVINSSEAASLIVYHTPGGNQKGTLRANTKFTVSKEQIDSNNVKWILGKGTGSNGKAIEGWIALCDMDEKDTAADTVLATGTVIADSLNVREASTTASDIMAPALTKGTLVKILAYKNEYTAAGTVSWGKIMHNGKVGWINLAYVDLQQVSAGDNDTLNGKTGVIVNADNVNIRSGAGVDKTLITTLKKGTKVTVYETVQVGTGKSAATWGRIKWDGVKEGWVYMFYVQLNGTSSDSSVGSEVAIYTGTVTSNTNLNVRNNPKVTSTQVGSLPTGTKINIYEVTTTNGVQWGRTDKGWVCLLYVNMTATGAASNGNGNGNHVLVTDEGTITAATLSLRKAATNNSEQLALLEKGDKVTILEQATETTATGSKLWGKVTVNGVTGWINLAYVDINEKTTIIPDTDATPGGSTGAASNGIVANCVTLNVRAAAGVRNALVTTLPNGTAVTVYEQTTKDGAQWGRIDQGWVAMQYINLTGTTSGTTGSTGTTTIPGATEPGVISATGIVNSNTDLNVRAGAGLGYAKVTTLKKGTSVTIYEQTVADGMIWGKTKDGWVCMSYITINSSSNSGTGVMGTIARCFSHVNVRSAPGTGNALVGTIQVGARVEVYEQRLYSGQYWGRVAQGWVCMQYVVLDGELPPTEDTTPTTPDPDAGNSGVVNNNPAVSYSFSGIAASNLNVRKDADKEADLAGTISSGTALNFVALKMNGTETWGQITEYGTPGWINLENVNFSIAGYAQYSNVTVYSIASTSGEGIGLLNLNEAVSIYALALNGSEVWGKLDVDTVNGVVGWVQMSKIGYAPAAISATDNVSGLVTGTTIAAIDAYTDVTATTASHKLAAGATVYVTQYVADHGTVWGKVSIGGQVAYVDMSKLAYTISSSVAVTELNVRNVPASNPDSTVLGTLASGAGVTITSLMAASDGSIWGQIQTTDTALNGGWVDIQHLA